MSQALERLFQIMIDLRDPVTGCPWDIKQDHRSIAHCGIEEAYEVAEAIESGDMAAVRDELGDLLVQVIFHAQMAKEKGVFDFDAIVTGAAEKLVERHPHVFGAESERLRSESDVLKAWETGKAARKAAASNVDWVSVLDGVSTSLPTFLRTCKLQQRAGRVGWYQGAEPAKVIAKLQEEIAEVEAELAPASGAVPDPARVEDEVGDVLFVAISLARSLKVDPEQALRHANRKFERRFRHIETRLHDQNKDFKDTTMAEMYDLWVEAKTLEATPTAMTGT